MSPESKRKIGYLLLSLAIIGGIFFLCITCYFGLSYYIDDENPLRHEYAIGMAIAWMCAVPFWLFASIVSLIMKETIIKKLSKVIYVIALVNTISFFWFAFVQPVIESS